MGVHNNLVTALLKNYIKNYSFSKTECTFSWMFLNLTLLNLPGKLGLSSFLSFILLPWRQIHADLLNMYLILCFLRRWENVCVSGEPLENSCHYSEHFVHQSYILQCSTFYFPEPPPLCQSVNVGRGQCHRAAAVKQSVLHLTGSVSSGSAQQLLWLLGVWQACAASDKCITLIHCTSFKRAHQL